MDMKKIGTVLAAIAVLVAGVHLISVRTVIAFFAG